MMNRSFLAIVVAACLQVAVPETAEAQISVTIHQTSLSSGDPVCFSDAYGVWHHTPGSWAGWTRQMPGHVGEKCWYPTTREKRHEQWKEVVRPANKATDATRPRLVATRPAEAAVHPSRPISPENVKLFIEFERWKQGRKWNELVPPGPRPN